MLSVGIIGLPNVGKSSLFNALTAGHANVSNYPFTTISSNVGVVPVPDPRLDRLAQILAPEEVTPCFLQLIDIAGLVAGASRGEGLGNQFLGEIRQVDAVAHLLRCFADPEVAHVFAGVDPRRDAEVVETELLLADLGVLDRAIAKQERAWKADPAAHEAERARLLSYRARLEEGVPLRRLDLDRAARLELATMGLITGKPMLWVANLDEEEIGRAEAPALAALARWAAGSAGSTEAVEVLAVSAKIEWELAQLEPDERRELMPELGLADTGLERLAEAAFHLLGLARFYTIANRKLRAWEFERGTHAAQAAGKIHSDMERGFIRAQVATYADLAEHGDFHHLARLGRLRTEGRDYEVADGDVMEILFH